MEINTPDEELHYPTSNDTNDSEHLSGESALVAEEHLLETEEEDVQEVSFTKHIYSDILFHPKVTFQRLLAVNGSVWVKKRVLLLLLLVCIPQAFTVSHATDKFADMNLYYAVKGYLGYYGFNILKNIAISACVYTFVILLFLVVGRKVLDRDVKFRDYSTIVAWAHIPAIVANFVVLGIQTIVSKIFTAEYYLTHAVDSTVTTVKAILVSSILIKLAFWLWSIYLVGYGINVLYSFRLRETLSTIIILILFVIALLVLGANLSPYLFTTSF